MAALRLRSLAGEAALGLVLRPPAEDRGGEDVVEDLVAGVAGAVGGRERAQDALLGQAGEDGCEEAGLDAAVGGEVARRPWATLVPDGVTRWLKAAAAASRCSGVKAASAAPRWSWTIRSAPPSRWKVSSRSVLEPASRSVCQSRASTSCRKAVSTPSPGREGQPRRAAGAQLDLAGARVGEHGLDELGLDLDGPGGIRQVRVAAQRPHDGVSRGRPVEESEPQRVGEERRDACAEHVEAAESVLA